MNTRPSRIIKIPTLPFSVLVALLICWSQLFIASQAAASSLSADQATSVFYKWYLHSLAAGREPLSDDRRTLFKYVARALVGDIEKSMHSDEGLDEDYFIKAQDYLDEWESTIVVDKPAVSGSTAVVALQLGRSRDNLRRFSIALIKEAGAWKIRRVQLVK
jgi:hypothetical protein